MLKQIDRTCRSMRFKKLLLVIKKLLPLKPNLSLALIYLSRKENRTERLFDIQHSFLFVLR